MERDRKLVILVSLATVVIFVFSYAVGYFVGKQAGIKEERAKCELEKKQIVKTFARIAPVSRPQPQIEEKIVAPKEQEQVEEKEKSEESEKVVKEEEPVATPSQTNQTEESVGEVEEKESSSKPQGTGTLKAESSTGTFEKAEKLYYLQVGVFKNRANAVRLASELKSKGFNAKTEFLGDYARVIVGYFKSWQEANAVRKELLNSGYKSILKWRKD
ncbi:cell division protein FtsN [Thermovibrio guaymasensis]|uniref:Cell division protein FtsN n=1 Tax=Thermovibrio guaymasensis TaxID=240167 RepID=A0A420W9P8_9BACT|nr:SPOR domain-containing protein [Thermovibrio guaymasensis]RKQ63988.1 cell division protein FtsN [Thermovibrio guaymasensis]